MRNPKTIKKKEETATSPAPPKRPPRQPRKKSSRPSAKVVVEVPSDLRGTRPSRAVMEQRQDEAYRLRLLGKTPEQIAELWGMAPVTIYQYVQAARERHITELRNLEGRAGVAHQFQVLNHVLEESLAAWERSKQVVKTKTAGVKTKDVTLGKDGKGPGIPGVETTKQSAQREQEQVGDPVFLARAMEASKQIRELLGLDPPEVKRLLMGNDPLTTDNNDDLANLPTEELLRRYRTSVALGPELGR